MILSLKPLSKSETFLPITAMELSLHSKLIVMTTSMDFGLALSFQIGFGALVMGSGISLNWVFSLALIDASMQKYHQHPSPLHSLCTSLWKYCS
jgi:hypothetical protein